MNKNKCTLFSLISTHLQSQINHKPISQLSLSKKTQQYPLTTASCFSGSSSTSHTLTIYDRVIQIDPNDYEGVALILKQIEKTAQLSEQTRMSICLLVVSRAYNINKDLQEMYMDCMQRYEQYFFQKALK